MSSKIESPAKTRYVSGSQKVFDNRISELLTVKDVAKLFKYSEKSIRRWVLEGKIPVVRPHPRSVRFDSEVIRKWLSERSEYERQSF